MNLEYKSSSGRAWLLGRVLPLFVFVFSSFFPLCIRSQSQNTPRKASTNLKTPLAFKSLWIESFDFFESEQDEESIAKLVGLSLIEPGENFEIQNRIFEHHLKRKDRVLLNGFAVDLAQAHRCDGGFERGPCRDLGALWHNNLDSVLFYESSPGLIIKVRKLLEGRECAEAQKLLRPMVSSEGDVKPVLELALDVMMCLGDTPAASTVRQKLELLKTLKREEPGL